VRPPNDCIAAVIGKPGTNATNPFTGRLAVTMGADFTMSPPEKVALDEQRRRM
jgi:hypothetical protein